MEAKGYAQMSSAIPPNTVGYTYTHRRAVALYSTFFSGVIRAPAGYISLGQEINRISRALEHLILEARSPESNLLRNAHGATETLGIALNGVEGSLIEIENVLLELQISRQNQSRWIDFEMQGPCGGEKRLKELEEQIGYHCWAFDLIMRTLMKDDSREIMASIQTLAVAAQLKRLLYEHIRKLEDVTITRRFEENCGYRGKKLFVDFTTDAMIRIVMFWSFKAITSLRHVSETKHVSADGYLNLLKAAWLLQKIRSTPKIVPGFAEIKATKALVSTELLFAFKSLVVGVGLLPNKKSIDCHGDFRIFPEHLYTEIIPPSRRERPASRAQHQDLMQSVGIQSNEQAVSGVINRRSTQSLDPEPPMSPLPLPPPPPYTAIVGDAPNPPPIFPPPGIPQHTPKRKKNRPSSLRMDTLRRNEDHELSTIASPTSPRAPMNGFPATTPTATTPTATTPTATTPTATTPTAKTPTAKTPPAKTPPAKTPPAEKEIGEFEVPAPSPSLSAIIDGAYCDSPTLGNFEVAVTIEPATPNTPIPFHRAFSSPSQLHSKQTNGALHTGSGNELSRAQSLDLTRRPHAREEYSFTSVTLPDIISGVPLNMDAKSILTGPPSSIVLSTDGRDIDQGVRPGEREVMPEVFAAMKLKSSKSLVDIWEDCNIRIFQSEREFRILTFCRDNIDQKYVISSTTELVPEYGYHENLPVIFLRQKVLTRPITKERSTKLVRKSSIISSRSAASLRIRPPVTLYYKFLSLIDMFSFQQAFLRESVEADTQNARAIKYTRGFLSGEQTTNNARVQLWKPLEAEDFGDTVSCRNSLTGASVGLGSTKRSVAPSEQIRVKPTRLVLYLDEMIYSIFITDDLVHTISNTSPRTLKIRPSSHRRGFNNPTSVKACVLGDPKRDISGGFRLDKEGLGIESQEAFDDFKWLEIVFQTEAECAYFVEDISVALQERRKERRVVEVLRKKAGRGVKAGEGLT